MTDAEIEALWKEFHIPEHVRLHCVAVAEFAVELGKKVRVRGEPVDLGVLRAAGLLHDLFRVVDFRDFHPEKFPVLGTPEDVAYWKALRERYRGRGHEEVCSELLRARGFAQEAEVVEKHRFLQILEGFDTWEEKLLYYADKRTKHDRVVPLAERLADGRKRNNPDTVGTKQAAEVDGKVFELEKEILAKIGGL